MAKKTQAKKQGVQSQQHFDTNNRESTQDAYTYVLNGLVNGTLDTKTADSITQSLRGSVRLRHEIPLKTLELLIRAHGKKVTVPSGLLPQITETS
jgi:hypothetical protein